MTGANLKQILNLLPLCIRQQDKALHTAETNVERRKAQYLKIKDWVNETLVLGGTSQSEKPETKVTMVAIGNNQHDRNLPSNDSDNQRRGGRQQK